MKYFTWIVPIVLIGSCSNKTDRENFLEQSDLQICTNTNVAQMPSKQVETGVDYRYEAKLTNIDKCPSMKISQIERRGYVCRQSTNEYRCSRVFSDGSISQLRLVGNNAYFARRHHL